MMEARDEETGAAMSDRQLRDEVITLFLAGHETTANVLSWTFYLLATHPDVEERLRAELDDVLISDGGRRSPTVEDLARLPYARMVIEEAMRLYPPRRPGSPTGRPWRTMRSAATASRRARS